MENPIQMDDQWGTHMTYLGNLHDLLNGDFPVRKLSND